MNYLSSIVNLRSAYGPQQNNSKFSIEKLYTPAPNVPNSSFETNLRGKTGYNKSVELV